MKKILLIVLTLINCFVCAMEQNISSQPNFKNLSKQEQDKFLLVQKCLALEKANLILLQEKALLQKEKAELNQENANLEQEHSNLVKEQEKLKSVAKAPKNRGKIVK